MYEDHNTSSDQPDELLDSLAAEFRTPPPTPREEIWARIQAQRAGRAASGGILHFRTASARRSPAVRALAWVSGVAAVLAAGVLIGRLVPVGSPGPAVPAALAADQPAGDMVMGMAVRQYLGRTELLLAALRAGDPATEFAGTAQDLLGLTRLLLDAPALSDAPTRALLQDLELILAQVLALPAAANANQDRALIVAGLADRDLLTRLRNAVPATIAAAPVFHGEL